MTRQRRYTHTSNLFRIVKSSTMVFVTFLVSLVLLLQAIESQNGPTVDMIKSDPSTSETTKLVLTIPTLDQPPAYPLQISTNDRFLVDQNNQPFFLTGDSAWSLIVQLNESDVDYYLSNRQQKGFNTILVNLIEHLFASNAPSNIYGNPPFTGTPFITPNEAYFAYADYVISAAAQRGINVLLAPLYLGYGCGSQGWCSEVQAASLSDMTFWGQYVGNRYKSFPNLIWVIDGDADPSLYPGVQDKVSAFVTGLRQYDTVHLITAHHSRGEMAVTPWSGVSWLTLNNIYTDNQTYPLAQTAYNYSPTLPFFSIEAYYENDLNHVMTQQELRAQGYWTYLSGSFGYVFGNCPIWLLGGLTGGCDDDSADWKASLDHSGSINMFYMRALFASRLWQNLEPDWNHSIVTSGYGTFGNADYATTSGTPDGKLAIVYIPTMPLFAFTRTISVDMSKFSDMVTARWYDPTNGTYANIPGSPFNNSGTEKFTTPGINASGDGDWVLVLEAGSKPTPTITSTSIKTSTPIVPTRTLMKTDMPTTPTITPFFPTQSPSQQTAISSSTMIPTTTLPPLESDSTSKPVYYVLICFLSVGILLATMYLIWIFKRFDFFK